ncbi:MAG: hypothetical protein JWN48_4659 [Myxococcaceae bacterium]|nr:hypothetical protein [Myxococcaceae bacterium]
MDSTPWDGEQELFEGQPWAAPPDDESALARARALVKRALFGTIDPCLRLGPYELVRTLGEGGSGTVYEAIDTDRGGRVALKMLRERRFGWGDLQREFRVLAKLTHPNLVALYAFHAHGQEAYFTMELLEGTDVVRHVRAHTAAGEMPPEEVVRDCIDQLLKGLGCLHAAGMLHRDLKPGNVLATHDGRVVIVDAGLARELVRHPEEVRPAPSGAVAGTPPYMSPEQRCGAVLSVASDLFAVGVILYQMLTGRLPSGSSHPSSVANGVPEDLDRLCAQLLAKVPEHRLSAVAASVVPATRETEDGASVYVGRAAELAALEWALEQSRSGVVMAVIEGESGIGKTALIGHFIARHAADALALCGRCYEREVAPYKGFDELSAMLQTYLRSLAANEASELTPAHLEVSARMLPALAGEQRVGRREEQDSSEARAQAVEALRSLLGSLADRAPLILCIDDGQWSDVDGGQLLAALLCHAQAPKALVIVSSRAREPDADALQAAVAAAEDITGYRVEHLRLSLSPLAPRETQELSAHFARDRPALARQLARESRGHPLLLWQMAQAAREVAADRVEDTISRLDLAALTARRVARLNALERAVLQCLSVAAAPLPRIVVVRALSTFDADGVLSRLSAAQWVHTSGPRGEDRAQLAHDTLREAILRAWPADEREPMVRAILAALKAGPTYDPEALLPHCVQLGLHDEALGYAVEAARAAMRSLAFARAASRYELALSLLDSCASAPRFDPGMLQREFADALAHSGRGLQAARHYRELAERARDPVTVSCLYTQAAEQLMYNGVEAEALELMRRNCAVLGLAWPGRRATLELALAARAVRWLVRRRRARAQVDTLRRARVDFMASAWRLLLGYDARLTLYFAFGCLEESATQQDPALRAQGAALEALAHAIAPGARRARKAERLLSAALLASEDADVLRRARVENLAALSSLALGQNRAALAHARRAETRLRSVGASSQDLFESMNYTTIALLELGSVYEAARRWGSYAHEMRSRSDFLSAIWIRSHAGRVMAKHFPAGELEAVEAIVEEQERVLARFPSGTLRLTQTFTRVELALYRGQGALALKVLHEQRRSFRARDVLSRMHTINFRGRAALCAATHAAGSQRRSLVETAERAAAALARLGRPAAHVRALAMRSSTAAHRGDTERARRDIEACLALSTKEDLPGAAAVAERHLGRLLGGDRGATMIRSADAFLNAERIIEAERWSEWCMPSAASILELSK